MVVGSVRIPEFCFLLIFLRIYLRLTLFFNTVHWVFVTKIKILWIFPFFKLIHSESIPTKISDWIFFFGATFSMVGANVAYIFILLMRFSFINFFIIKKLLISWLKEDSGFEIWLWRIISIYIGHLILFSSINQLDLIFVLPVRAHSKRMNVFRKLCVSFSKFGYEGIIRINQILPMFDNI